MKIVQLRSSSRAGQLVNLSALSGDVGVSSTTLSGWLSALEASFIVYRLYPYHINLGKRLVKTPKIFFTETGLLSWLLQIETVEQAARDPLLGNIFENMVVMEAVKSAYNRGESPRLSYYRDKSGLEIDLIREYQRQPYAVEIKAGTTFVPDMIRSLRRFKALLDDFSGGALIYAGEEEFILDDITVTSYLNTAKLLIP